MLKLRKPRMCDLITVVVAGFMYTGCAGDPVLAQNPTCPTRPLGDNTNACASTAFVQNAISATFPALTHTHIFVGNGSNSAADFGTKVTFTDTGAGTLSPTSGNVLTINPAFATSDRGLTISQDGPRSGSFGANLNLNQIIINSDNANVTAANQYTYGLYAEMTTGGGSTHGSKATVGILMNFASSSTTAGDTQALNVVAQASAPNGGTNTGAGAAGTLFGASCVSHLTSGGTNYFSVSCGEYDIGIEVGGSAKHRFGLSFVGIGSVAAASFDSALEFSSAGQAFKSILLLSNIHGGGPLTAAGCVICTDSSADTITTFADLSTYTVSGNILNFANLTLTGAGTFTKTGYGSGALISTAGVITAGTLGVANGGTGDATLTANGVLYGNGTGAIQATAQGGANTVLVANAGAPSFTNSPRFGGNAHFSFVGGTGAGFWLDDNSGAPTDRFFFGSDAAAADSFRIFSTLGSGNVFTVTANATLSSTAAAMPGRLTVQNGTGISAGGVQDQGYLFSSTAHFGMIFGSGAPSASMAQGSLYLRSNGGAGTLLYVNTNGTTGWQGIASIADVGQFITAPTNVNFNAAGDTTFTLPLPVGSTRVVGIQVVITGASGSLAGMTFGLFTASGGGGNAIIAAGTTSGVTTGTDATDNNESLTNQTSINIRSYVITSNQVFFRVGATVAQTANVQIRGYYTN